MKILKRKEKLPNSIETISFKDFLIEKKIPFEVNPEDKEEVLVCEEDLELHLNEIFVRFPRFRSSYTEANVDNYKQGSSDNTLLNC